MDSASLDNWHKESVRFLSFRVTKVKDMDNNILKKTNASIVSKSERKSANQQQDCFFYDTERDKIVMYSDNNWWNGINTEMFITVQRQV